MPDLAELLHDLAGPQRAISPDEVRERVGRRRRRHRWIAAAAAGALVAAASGAALIVANRGATPQREVNVVGPEPEPSVPSGWTPLPPGPADGRGATPLVWTGRELIVWGGEAVADAPLGTGSAFDPSSNSWRALSDAPIAPRSGHAAVWTGEEMIVCCGGVEPTGQIGAYDPDVDQWRMLDSVSELELIKYPTAVWTGDRMIVAGGVSDGGAGGSLDGALQLDPAANMWQGIGPRSPISIERSATALWTGREMIVVPHVFGSSMPAAYDPAADAWRELPTPPDDLTLHGPSAVWTGEELIVWGVTREAIDGEYRAVGARLDPDGATWQSLAPAPLGPVDWWEGTPGSSTAVWDALRGRMLLYTGAVGSGARQDAPTPVLAYYPATDSWQELPPLPDSPFHPAMVLAGDALIISGTSGFHSLDLATVDAEPPREQQTVESTVAPARYTVTVVPGAETGLPGTFDPIYPAEGPAGLLLTGTDIGGATPVKTLWSSADGRRWQRVDMSVFHGDVRYPAMATTSHYLVQILAPGVDDATSTARLYTSVDAQNWRLALEEPSDDLGNVFAAGDRFFRVRSTDVLVSADGATWEPTLFAGRTVDLRYAGIFSTGLGHLLLEQDESFRLSGAWLSEDGREWTELPPPAAVQAGLVAGKDGIVVTAAADPQEPADCPTFDPQSGPPPPASPCRFRLQLAIFDTATGQIGSDGAVVLTTDDQGFGLVAGEGGWVATRTDGSSVEAWISSDGRTWTAAEPTEVGRPPAGGFRPNGLGAVLVVDGAAIGEPPSVVLVEPADGPFVGEDDPLSATLHLPDSNERPLPPAVPSLPPQRSVRRETHRATRCNTIRSNTVASDQADMVDTPPEQDTPRDLNRQQPTTKNPSPLRHHDREPCRMMHPPQHRSFASSWP